MNKIRVAIIDSGIDINNKLLKNSIYYGYNLSRENGKIIYGKNYDDFFGHGTACASAIFRYCSNIEFIIVKIMNEQGRTNLYLVEEALKSLINLKVDVINLSFSFSKIIDKNIYKLCNILFKQNKIILSSFDNEEKDSYPAFFDNVIGVKGVNLEYDNEFWFNKNYKIQCVVDNTPFMSCGLGNTYQMKKSNNSLATAKMTGILCNLLYENNFKINYNNIYSLLSNSATCKIWNENNLTNKQKVIDKNNCYIENNDYLLNKVYELSIKKININRIGVNICDYELLSEKNGLPISIVYNYIKYISESLNINVNYMEINKNNLITLGSFTKYLKKKMGEKNI